VSSTFQATIFQKISLFATDRNRRFLLYSKNT